ncbi:MAG: T9SS type A sorting domain-containing protein [Saprospiraceae bacterium]|nr:T9SS type A sorting domain-containing protein [Saprospiraceae bacterium]
MRLSSFLFVFFVSIQLGFSQWSYVNTGPNVESFDVGFADPMNGFIVGVNGMVRRTKDGGYTWENMDVGISEWLYSISFFTPKVGFIAGKNHVFRTDDGGDTWTIVEGLNKEVRTKVYVRDSLFGFICGEQNVLRTIDGGMSWNSISVNTDKWISNVHFPTPDTGYAVISGYAWEYHKSIDGGLTWDSIGLPGFGLSTFSGVYFQTGLKGFIGGYYFNVFKQTNDGGLTWTDVDVAPSANISGFWFKSDLEGYAAGNNSTLFRTIDGGVSWMPELIIPSTSISSLAYPNDSTVVALGSNSDIFIREASTVSVKDPTLLSGQQLTLIPNPAQDQIWITDDEQIAETDILAIYNIQGILVLSVPGMLPGKSLDISSLRRGTYVIKVTNQDSIVRMGLFQKL